MREPNEAEWSTMYVPRHDRQKDRNELHQLIRDSRLATFVTVRDGRPYASHVPMLLRNESRGHGSLLCHLARANPHAKAIRSGNEALVMFLGVDGYVSPSWYESKREHGKVVPTWNYTAVHASGPIRRIEELEELRELVNALTQRHESPRLRPWQVDDAPAVFVTEQLQAIVGFEITIEALEGKWKLSRARSRADFAGVVEGLAGSADSSDLALASTMKRADAGIDDRL